MFGLLCSQAWTFLASEAMRLFGCLILAIDALEARFALKCGLFPQVAENATLMAVHAATAVYSECSDTASVARKGVRQVLCLGRVLGAKPQAP